MLNGLVGFGSSRGQKVVSLSSAKSELYALVSGGSDGIFNSRCLAFLNDEDIYHVCWVDGATRQLSNKRGAGRLRHVKGKLLRAPNMPGQGFSAQKTNPLEPK